MLVQATALLCALSAAAFAAAGGERPRLLVVVAVAAFVAAALWIDPRPSAVGGLVMLSAAVLLRWPRLGPPAVVVSGLAAGWWGSMLAHAGLPAAPAWILAGSIPVASAVLASRHREFAPTVLREEALLTVGMLGIVVGAGPSVVDGWGAASALNLDPTGGVRQTVGLWVLALTALSASLGGWHSLRRRR